MRKMKLGSLFVSLVIIILLSLEFGVCDVATNSTTLEGMCIQRETAALLTFKETLVEYPYSNNNNHILILILPSWISSNRDCCSWEAVTCHKVTGHVIALDLTRGNKPYEETLVANRLDSSLLELRHLSYLDLSSIYFNYSKFPAYLGSLKQLHYLNLSYTGFSGTVPHHLGNLTSLRALDLNAGRYSGLKVDDLTWASRLSSLEHLDMSGANLSLATHAFEVLNTLPSLHYLSLSWSHLDSRHLPHSCTNSTLLANFQHLDLSYNSFDGEFPCFLPNMTSLTFLDLSWNKFNLSSGTHLLGLKLLTHLNLAFTLTWQDNKVDLYSDLLRDKIHLKSLDIQRNRINGNILGLFKNFSCHKIESLSLRDNNLHGELPQVLGELSYLKSLDISSNNFSGPFPSWLPNLTSLRSLYLSRNQLSRGIPVSLGKLSNLEVIDISFNCLETTLSEDHFAKLYKVVELDLSFNKMIRFGVGYDWVPTFQLTYLSLRSSEVGGQFPQWLQTQKALETLDLSNCSIGGTFPAWIHSLTSLTYLYLSHNNISGPIPKLSSSSLWLLDASDNMITHLPTNIGHMQPHLEYLILARNLINTSIPYSICRIKYLYILDLSRNRFSGYLPNCNWSSFEQLRIASFSSNELIGAIPTHIGEARSLMRLRLDGNRLTGQLPSTLKNCKWLDLLDVGGNNLSGKLPKWIGKHLHSLRILRLRNNEISGPIPRELCRLSKLQVLDLGNNKLTGSIPYCFANFSAMMINVQQIGILFMFSGTFVYSERLNQVIKGVDQEYTRNLQYVVNLDLSSNHLVGEIPWELTILSGLIGLNLSHNHLKGRIPENIGDMKSLESLDLSNNNLQGVIPYSLSSLSFLSRLNFSNNNLSGQIPTGRQLQTLDDPSIYQGNPLLCGAPLQRKCDEPGIAQGVQNHKEEADEDRADKIWFYGIIIAGFATGFWAVIGVMVVKTKWRQAYFRYIQVSMAKMLGY